MSQLLVNNPQGRQELIFVDEGGGYFDLARVLWDERTDGPMPAITLNAMVRNGAGLAIDAALQAAHDALTQAAAIAQLQANIVQKTQDRLDDFARTRNYDGILSACTYATSSVPKFAAEGQYAVNARDNTWASLYAFMGEVQAGTRPMPSGFADVEPLLPTLNWPT